jgi:hypothetical protein
MHSLSLWLRGLFGNTVSEISLQPHTLFRTRPQRRRLRLSLTLRQPEEIKFKIIRFHILVGWQSLFSQIKRFY